MIGSWTEIAVLLRNFSGFIWDVFMVHICLARARIQYLRSSSIFHFGGIILRIGFTSKLAEEPGIAFLIWKKIEKKIFFIFLAYNNTPQPPMSVHKKVQPNRSSRLAGYRQHKYIYIYIYMNVLFYCIDYLELGLF